MTDNPFCETCGGAGASEFYGNLLCDNCFDKWVKEVTVVDDAPVPIDGD